MRAIESQFRAKPVLAPQLVWTYNPTLGISTTTASEIDFPSLYLLVTLVPPVLTGLHSQ